MESLKQRADKMIHKNPHPYLIDQLLESSSNLYCAGNFKISHLNISCNLYYLNINNLLNILINV